MKKNKPAVYSRDGRNNETFEQLNEFILPYCRIQMTADKEAD